MKKASGQALSMPDSNLENTSHELFFSLNTLSIAPRSLNIMTVSLSRNSSSSILPPRHRPSSPYGPTKSVKTYLFGYSIVLLTCPARRIDLLFLFRIRMKNYAARDLCPCEHGARAELPILYLYRGSSIAPTRVLM